MTAPGLFHRAVTLLQQGQREDAMMLLEEERVRVLQRVGAEAPEHAEMLRDQGRLLSIAGEYEASAEKLRMAVAITPTSPSQVRGRLTSQMTLGEVLRRAGLCDESCTVLRASLEERRAFYGPDHPGVAYGLESLAAALLVSGQLGEASARIDHAVSILVAHGNPRQAQARFLRAVIRSVRGMPIDFKGMAEWPDALVCAICSEAGHLAAGLGVGAPHLWEVTCLLHCVLGERSTLTGVLQRLAGPTNKALIARILAAKGEERLEATLAHALFLADAGFPDRATQRLMTAMVDANQQGFPRVARAMRIVTGVIEQHRGNYEVAAALLHRLTGLPVEPSGLVELARSHRTAEGCTCWSLQYAYTHACRDTIE